MSLDLTGHNLIAGTWSESETRFTSMPVSGDAKDYANATLQDVDRACQAAEAAFLPYSQTPRAERAAFLHAIADEIEARGATLTEIGHAETGLPTARLEGERGRTCGQLRLFAQHILSDDFLDLRHDPALPDRAPLPRPDLRMVQRPLGPVAVFGASNFPLAFSTAGGDTASALAAGCPVVVKGHPAHPGTAEVVAQAIDAAIMRCGVPAGVFSLLQGNSNALGAALVQHPLIAAVGFTGGLRGGRALFDLCAARPVPIPFFGELGSINPMFILPEAAATRAAEIGSGWAASLTMGAGQFCTNPGVALIVEGPEADALQAATLKALQESPAQTMLTEGIAQAYATGAAAIAETDAVTSVLAATPAPRAAEPGLYACSGDSWLAEDGLHEEVFGPAGLLVRVRDLDQMQQIARGLQGQLTCTLHMHEGDMQDGDMQVGDMQNGDMDLAAALLPVLERKAGRVLVNGFPTGVEVCDAMVHGGPYPASTNFGATSVGTLAIRRFLRPVCYQNLPAALVPMTQA